jgi:uracil-DNA glycosylase family 4
MNDFFVGPSGDLFNNILSRFGIPRSRLYLTNATLCRPPFREMSDAEKQKALDCCRPRLDRELANTRESIPVLAYGGMAFQMFTSIGYKKFRHYLGVPVQATQPEGSKRQVLGAYHPAFTLRPQGQAFVPSVFF